MRRRLRKKLALGEFAEFYATLDVRVQPDAVLGDFIQRFFDEGTAPLGGTFTGAADAGAGTLRGFVELGLLGHAQQRADRLAAWLAAAPEVAEAAVGPATAMG